MAYIRLFLMAHVQKHTHENSTLSRLATVPRAIDSVGRSVRCDASVASRRARKSTNGEQKEAKRDESARVGQENTNGFS